MLFKQTNLSSVTDCVFTASLESNIAGVVDAAGQGGNHYKNNRFDGNQDNQFTVEGATEFPLTTGPSAPKGLAL